MGPQIKIHPLLEMLRELSSVTVQRIANAALHSASMAVGDRVFHCGEIATCMYILVDGKLVYRTWDADDTHLDELFCPGSGWIAEPGLWTDRWAHRGSLTAIRESKVLAINSEAFGGQIRINPRALLFTSRYAQGFLEWLSGLSDGELSDLHQGEDMRDVCHSFIPMDMLQGVIEPAINVASLGSMALSSLFKRSPLRRSAGRLSRLCEG